MRLLFFCLLLGIMGCKKDKFTSAPQIKFVSVDPDNWDRIHNTAEFKQYAPKLTLNVTDAEGDLGYKAGSDTSWVYVRMIPDTRVDSFVLPVLGSYAGKDFQADVEINLYNAIHPLCINNGERDTLYFEVYLQDFAKNKSNVIVTDKPVYYICN